MALTDTAVRQLSDGNTQGTVLGVNPADLIGFYGVTSPVSQPTQANQAAIAQGLATAMAIQWGTTQSPVTVAPSTSAEQALSTVIGATSQLTPLTTDLIVVNKPTAQAGLGVGNPHVTTANQITINYANFTTASIAPTGSEVYAVATLRGWPTLTAKLSPTSVAGGTTVEQQFAVTGINAGDLVLVNKPANQAGLDIVGYRAVSNGVLGITFTNTTAATITPTAGESYLVSTITTGVDAGSEDVIYGLTATGITSIAVTTTAEQSLTTAKGVAATDTIVGISKPTFQAGLAIVGGRVTAANAVAITYANPTAASIAPTASDVYMVTTKKTQAPAPLTVIKQALIPVAVAPNTTAVQNFTVSGLIANAVIAVNKPSAQSGLGIAGAYCSATSTLSLVYSNSTSLSITPTSGEIYTIGQFAVAGAGVGTGVVQAQSVLPVLAYNDNQGNAIRLALVNTGLIAGQ